MDDTLRDASKYLGELILLHGEAVYANPEHFAAMAVRMARTPRSDAGARRASEVQDHASVPAILRVAAATAESASRSAH